LPSLSLPYFPFDAEITECDFPRTPEASPEIAMHQAISAMASFIDDLPSKFVQPN